MSRADPICTASRLVANAAATARRSLTLNWQTPAQALNRGSLQQPVETARPVKTGVTFP